MYLGLYCSITECLLQPIAPDPAAPSGRSAPPSPAAHAAAGGGHPCVDAVRLHHGGPAARLAASRACAIHLLPVHDAFKETEDEGRRRRGRG